MSDQLITEIINDVCELPDYTSPDDQPDLLQCRVHELKAILLNRLSTRSERTECEWQPMISLPGVLLRTEFLFKTERTGFDGLTHTHHEVMLLWPDGVLTDHSETVVAPEEMPTHWMRMPK